MNGKFEMELTKILGGDKSEVFVYEIEDIVPASAASGIDVNGFDYVLMTKDAATGEEAQFLISYEGDSFSIELDGETCVFKNAFRSY